jgi:hypothetical protein
MEAKPEVKERRRTDQAPVAREEEISVSSGAPNHTATDCVAGSERRAKSEVK